MGIARPSRLESDDSDSEGQLVVVRSHVVDNIGHVLGNLFQRLYHLVEQARVPSAGTADQLAASVRQLEDFLQLVMDYFAPVDLAFDYVSTSDVAQSLARQLGDQTGNAVTTIGDTPVEGRLLVDPGRMARCFAILATLLEKDTKSAQPIVIEVGARQPNRTVLLTARIPQSLMRARSSMLEMHWAVAEKFLEVHGGTLRQAKRLLAGSGEGLWEIVLPLQP